jgi:hypothetical protein
VPWLYNSTAGIFISYDDPQSLAAKTAYVEAQGLGGVMAWELSQDDGSLLDALYTGLQPRGLTITVPTPVPTARTGLPRPFEKDIHAVSGISVDGDLSDWPAEPDFTFSDEAQIVYHLSADSWSGPDDLSARAWAGWAEDGLYLAFDVTDDKHAQGSSGSGLWHGDYMELQVDTELEQDYDEKGMSADDYQIGISPGNFDGSPRRSSSGMGLQGIGPQSGDPGTGQDDHGYILEVFAPGAAPGHPAFRGRQLRDEHQPKRLRQPPAGPGADDVHLPDPGTQRPHDLGQDHPGALDPKTCRWSGGRNFMELVEGSRRACMRSVVSPEPGKSRHWSAAPQLK